jgi:DNA-binding response OmpR family regulator
MSVRPPDPSSPAPAVTAAAGGGGWAAVGVPRAATKGRLLVVDDDRLVLATVTHGLQKAGYEVFDADNGDEAILLAREHRPELALLDIRMEGKSGFDVAATLREAYRIPFMFLSAFSDPQTLAHVQALGALDYLVKPLDVGQIVPAVEAALAHARRQAAVAPPTAASAQAVADSHPGAAVDAQAPWLAEPLPLAVGVLMHRYSLTRQQALERLQRLAKSQAIHPREQAERLLAAVEELARSAL